MIAVRAQRQTRPGLLVRYSHHTFAKKYSYRRIRCLERWIPSGSGVSVSRRLTFCRPASANRVAHGMLVRSQRVRVAAESIIPFGCFRFPGDSETAVARFSAGYGLLQRSCFLPIVFFLCWLLFNNHCVRPAADIGAEVRQIPRTRDSLALQTGLRGYWA